MNDTPLLQDAFLNVSIDQEKLEQLKEYRELCMKYTCATKEIRTKFEVLSAEFSVKHRHNPIAHISTRLKSTQSIVKKLYSKGFDVTLENMRERIHDIAGVRIICPYIDDIYVLADALKRQKDITLIEEKDYIEFPKPNGYRSLHLIVSVPVFFADTASDVTVEVQIRTIAMDFWASLEHEIKYKQNAYNSEEIAQRLRNCAETIALTDIEMQNIRNDAEKFSEPQDTKELLIRSLDDFQKNPE